jgi:hypothetical protein
MKKGIALIILGVIIIASLFVVDGVASNQVYGPPYTYEQGEQHTVERWSTFYPGRAQGWIKEYYNIHQILWGVGLPLSAILIGLGFWVKGKNKHQDS